MICDLVRDEFEYLRLDGDTADPAERSRLVDKFNSDPDIFAFFLTTQVRRVMISIHLHSCQFSYARCSVSAIVFH